MQKEATVQPDQLRELVLFAGLPDEYITWCAPMFEEVEVPAGERVCGRTSIDHGFHIVVLGEVELLRDLEPVAALRTGQFWTCTRPLVDIRSFVSIATTDCWVARVLPPDYDLIRLAMPVLGERIDEVVAARERLIESS